jgi:hypothetical protein
MSLMGRFRDKYVPEPNSGCWLWDGGQRNALGYGYFHHPDEKYAHRASWALHYGAIPDGMLILHKCDNPYCVNPDHLFMGTHKDNTADMFRKGRGGTRGPKAGEAPYARLSVDDVIAIRGSNASSKATAVKYGVASCTISNIRSGRSRRLK